MAAGSRRGGGNKALPAGEAEAGAGPAAPLELELERGCHCQLGWCTATGTRRSSALARTRPNSDPGRQAGAKARRGGDVICVYGAGTGARWQVKLVGGRPDGWGRVE